MIVSDQHKFLYLSIPKTASGVTQDWFQRFGWCPSRMAPTNHLTIDQMIKHPRVGIDRWNSYKKTVFRRNPWDRYVSLFLWIRTINSRHPNRNQFPTFADYVGSGGETGQHQRDFIFNKEGKVIVDFVGCFETLKDSMDEMADFLGLQRPTHIGHTNLNSNKNRVHYSKYYTEQWMIDAVAERERFLIDAYGYKFGEDGERWRDR
jgi:hypothetical protein